MATMGMPPQMHSQMSSQMQSQMAPHQMPPQTQQQQQMQQQQMQQQHMPPQMQHQQMPPQMQHQQMPLQMQQQQQQQMPPQMQHQQMPPQMPPQIPSQMQPQMPSHAPPQLPSQMNQVQTQPVITPRYPVGFDSITKQIEKKSLKRGFQFNVICVGQTGLGKSTLINTLFASHLLKSKGRLLPDEPIRSTTEIQSVQHIIEENGVKLRLNIVDTPGYGDLVNNDRCWEPIQRYIKYQYGAYLHKELTAQRERHITDSRIHCCLFFIQPSGHSLKPIDIVVLKHLSQLVNIVPVIAKADSMTLEERQIFKDKIRQEFSFHNIRIYPYDSDDYDQDEVTMNAQIKSLIPFAVVGSEKTVNLNGRPVRARQNRWGIVNIEDENHCDFVYLRNFLTRTHLQDLIETTGQIHYENYRGKELLALKERSTAGGMGGSRPISPSAERELSRNSQRITLNGY